MKLWPIAEVVPHRDAMCLLDEMTRLESHGIACTMIVRKGGLFNDSEGALPAWTGVELMAQAIAAWAGAQARNEQRPVRLGFLLGTRQYQSNVDAFPVGTVLRVEANQTFHDDNGMGSFACRISAPDIEATAQLSVFSPPDADRFFAQACARAEDASP